MLAGWREIERDAPVPRNTLTAMNILAELLHAQNKDAEAEPLCREVLGGFTQAVGPRHPFSISAAENLSAVLRAIKKTDEADAVLQQFGLSRPCETVGEETEVNSARGRERAANAMQNVANGSGPNGRKNGEGASKKSGKKKAGKGSTSPATGPDIEQD